MTPMQRPGMWIACFLIASAGLLAAGSGAATSNSATTLKMSIGESGKSASFKAPKTAEGGLVDVKLTNDGKAPHGVQFIQYTGDHTMQDVLKALASNSNVIPSWAKLNGGIGSVARGRPAARPSTSRWATTCSPTPRRSEAAAARRPPRHQAQRWVERQPARHAGAGHRRDRGQGQVQVGHLRAEVGQQHGHLQLQGQTTRCT